MRRKKLACAIPEKNQLVQQNRNNNKPVQCEGMQQKKNKNGRKNNHNNQQLTIACHHCSKHWHIKQKQQSMIPHQVQYQVASQPDFHARSVSGSGKVCNSGASLVPGTWYR